MSPRHVPALRGTHTAPTMCLSRAGAGDSLRQEAAATGRMWAVPRARVSFSLFTLKAQPLIPGRRGSVERVPGFSTWMPALLTSADRLQQIPAEAGRAPCRKLQSGWTIVSLQAPSPSSQKVPLGDQCPQDEEGASQAPKQGAAHPGLGLCWRPRASVFQDSLAPGLSQGPQLCEPQACS